MAEVERPVSLGARRVDSARDGRPRVTLLDPEGDGFPRPG
ncbi:hypothetical protein IF129_02320 [Streptomyces chumphonensis]|uniref:Glyoxalase-like domain-containing protein n=1 Tax=Streptomyces chumphonensis TaxID=1214925 RepID=A0A927EX77_9ACTN|nr:VOC family protein [Streptomyces chumphonensis]MBD3930411.1 hypothetical protein [Streptomyces chumphonensis]